MISLWKLSGLKAINLDAILICGTINMSTDNDKKMISESGLENKTLGFTQDYRVLLTNLKDKIRSAWLSAALAINKEVIELFWHIG